MNLEPLVGSVKGAPAWDIENVAGRVRGPGGKPPATRLLRVGAVEATKTLISTGHICNYIYMSTPIPSTSMNPPS